MLQRSVFPAFLCISAALTLGCGSIFSSLLSPKPSPTPISKPTPTPTPRPKPVIAYLINEALYAIRSDGTDQRLLAKPPDGEVIQDFIWSPDGEKIYHTIGLKLYEVSIETGVLSSTGQLVVPAGSTIDRLEAGNDVKSVIIHVIDEKGLLQTYSMDVSSGVGKVLSVDEYLSSIRVKGPVVRNIGEMSVSPDGSRILYKSRIGTGEELFISDVEKGAGRQLTNLYDLSGFEESIETEGGRRVIEASWSPDGNHVVFNPMQSCSETGLCYGRLFIVNSWSGLQKQISDEMTIDVPNEWTPDGMSLVFADAGRIVVVDSGVAPRFLTEGQKPKWRPQPARD